MGRRIKIKPWTTAEVKQLGRVPDSVLARETGRTLRDILQQREARRIALPTGPRRWTAGEIRLLGKMTDTEVARRLRRPLQHVRLQRIALDIPILKPAAPSRPWTTEEIRLLGKRPDAE